MTAYAELILCVLVGCLSASVIQALVVAIWDDWRVTQRAKRFDALREERINGKPYRVPK